MKKIFFTLAVIMISTAANAQHFEWGAKAGLNLATETKLDDGKMRAGFYIGAVGEYVFNEFIGVQAELLYSMQGAKMEETDGGNTTKITDKRDYINLPILAKFYVWDGLSVDLGPQFGYLINAKISGDTNGVDVTSNYYDEDGVNKFDVSFAIGLSYKLPFRLEVSARYNLGLTKLFDIDDDKTKNSVIQVGVGYKF